MTEITRQWVSKAEGDYTAASILRKSRKPGRYDAICFHCQQCVEKYLKARLNEAGLRIVKTHDLGMLLRLVQPLEPLWMGMDAPLKRLTDMAVACRYPGMTTDLPAAREAFETCRNFREMVRPSFT
jgi:HEPN domain-containing protein